jgi:hypothetical protein
MTTCGGMPHKILNDRTGNVTVLFCAGPVRMAVDSGDPYSHLRAATLFQIHQRRKALIGDMKQWYTQPPLNP